jgi:hypothetical protein
MKQIQCHDTFAIFVAALFAMGLQTACSSQAGPTEQDLSSTQAALQAPESPPAAVLKAAQSQLAELLNSIPPGQEADFGFTSRQEFVDAKVVAPYEMLSVDTGGAIAALEEWRVPVVVGNRFCMLIDMRKSGDSYAAVGIGAAQLASELGQEESDTNSVQAVQPSRLKSILRSFKHTADFVVYDLNPRDSLNKNQLKMRPLKSARMSLASKAEKLRSGGKSFGATGGKAKSRELTMSDVQSLLDD